MKLMFFVFENFNLNIIKCGSKILTIKCGHTLKWQTKETIEKWQQDDKACEQHTSLHRQHISAVKTFAYAHICILVYMCVCVLMCVCALMCVGTESRVTVVELRVYGRRQSWRVEIC